MAEREPTQKDSRLNPTSAVLDEAHVGDIQGAFGTIRLSDVAPRRTWRRRLLTLAAIVGPGIIVMVGDNDAGGVSTYAQAGQDFGYSLLWTLLLLIPVLIVNQEMVVRLGRRHRRRPCAADHGEVRSILGMVLGRRPLPPQLPDHQRRNSSGSSSRPNISA